MKTHKILIKNKLFLTLNEAETNIFMNKLITSEVRVKIFDKQKNIFINPYTNEISLLPLDDIEKILENTDLCNRQKNYIYNLLKSREEDRQRINSDIIQNIIDEVLKLDNNL
jgi:hypothetical protein